MTSPFIPCSFSYGDAPAGGSVMPMVIAGRDPSDTIDKQYQAGYLWLSSLDMGGSGNMYVQSGNTSGEPNWTSVTAGAAGGVSTLSDGSTQVSPVGGNIALEGTANQITSTSDVSGHDITFSIPSVFIAPGSIKASTTLEVGTDLTVDGNASVTGNLAVTGNETITGDLTVTGNLVTGGITENGNVGINTTGAGTTTIGNAAAGLIKFDVGTGDFKINGGGNDIDIGTDAAANTILIGNTNTTTSVHIESGTGDIKIDGATTAEIFLGTTTQTGTITIGQSTAGENIDIGSGINVGAQVITIGNGDSGANSTVDILSGAGTAGAGVLALGNNARVTTIGMGNVAPAAARVITIAGGNQAQNDTVTILGGAASAGTQTFNLFNGNSAGATQNVNIGTGTGAVGINIGTGATGVKTIAIGGTAANVITIANTQTAGSLTIGNAMTSGTVTIGGNSMTGTINIGTANNATGQIVNILSAATITGQNFLHLLDGATPAANQTVSIMTGVGTAGTYTFNLLTGNSTGTTQAVNIATGSAATTISVGGTGANTVAIANTQTGGSLSLAHAMTTGNIAIGDAQTTGTLTIGSTAAGSGAVRIVDGTGAQIINFATGAGAKTLTIGSTNTTSTTTINAGSGNIVMVGAVTKTTNPAFLAYLAATANNKTGDGTSYTLGTDALTEVFDRGTNFNTNGTFTAPVTGIYDLRAQVAVSGCTIATTFAISIVTTLRTYTNTFVRTASADNHMCEISALCDMTATNTATVTIVVTGEAAATDEITGGATLVSYFCGCLVA